MIEFVKENAALLVDALQIVTGRLNIWWLLFYAASYALLSLGLFKLAKNRCIDRPWLAWLPIGNLWILGCLADQYRKLVKQENANSRDRLFWAQMVVAGLLIAMVALIVVGISYLGENAPSMSVSAEALDALDTLSGDQLSEAYLQLMAQMVSANADVARTVSVGLIGLAILVVALVAAVVYLEVEKYRALYYLLASSLPKHKVWMLVVSIVLGVEAIFIFVCRKQNQGMPHDKKGRLQVI